MTRGEKIDEIYELDRENRNILSVIEDFNKNNPDKMYIEVRKIDYEYDLHYSVRITGEILIAVIEILENKLNENNKRLDELLGVDDD